MLQRWWFKLYVTALVVAAFAILIPMLPIPKDTDVSRVALPVEALQFYSTSIPLEARLKASSWMSKNSIKDQSAANVTVREGSFTDITYRLGTQLRRDTSVIIDVKDPKVSYTLLTSTDPLGNVPPLISIGCVDSSSTLAICQEMIRT